MSEEFKLKCLLMVVKIVVTDYESLLRLKRFQILWLFAEAICTYGFSLKQLEQFCAFLFVVMVFFLCVCFFLFF